MHQQLDRERPFRQGEALQKDQTPKPVKRKTKSTLERYNAWRERYLKWGVQYNWVTDVVLVGGHTVIPKMVPSLHLTVEDVNILPLQQHDKEPATRSQQEEPNKPP